MTDRSLAPAPHAAAYLVAGIATSFGIVVGSIGPWLQVFTFSVRGLEVEGCGYATLALGGASVIALATVRGLLRSRSDVGWTVALAWGVFIAGVGCLAVAVVNIVTFSSASTEILGEAIDVRAGWGLWVVTICAAVLCLTTGIVAVQVGNASNQAAWGWAALAGSTIIVLCTIAYIWATVSRGNGYTSLLRLIEHLQH